jgi:hypothetical protein
MSLPLQQLAAVVPEPAAVSMIGAGVGPYAPASPS